MKNYYFKSLFFSLLLILSLFNVSSSFAQQTCANSLNSWEWPTHTNWYSGQAQMMNFGASGGSGATNSTFVGPSAPFFAYESCASASDEDGNLVIFTNGVKLWDGTGNEVAVPGGLKTGAEIAGGSTGSAVQGVIIVKHPLDPDNYYIFTTDDAIGGRQNGITNGFNYYIYNRVSNTCSGATRLGGYRSTEQVAATFHKNGVDVWIVTHESVIGSTTNKYLAYLLECNGVDPVPVESNIGFNVLANNTYLNWQNNVVNSNEYSNERGSIEFAPNPTLATTISCASTFHCGQGTWDPVGSVSLLDFNTSNGTFGNHRGVGDGTVAHSNPYDCEFSGDGGTLYVSFQADPFSGPLLGRLGKFDVGSGAYTEVGNTGSGAITIGSVKLGGDGQIYCAQFQSQGFVYRDDFVSSNGSTLSLTGLAAAPQTVGYGLPNMFVPPRDWLEIQDPGVLDECSLPVDLETEWICKGGSAENTSRYENAYSVATTGPNACATCTIDPVTGVFNAPGAGTYEVYFEICEIKDTIIFDVGVCGCDVDVSVGGEICAGEEFLLDTAIVSASGIGVWTIDSFPSTPGVDAVINDSGVDTLFDATNPNTKYGVYKLMFRVDDTCEDSLYIEVKKLPTPIITEIGSLCEDSVLTNMVALPILGGDVTAAGFAINELPIINNVFDPVALGAGTHKVFYGVDSLGCLNADSIDVIVRPRPEPVITQVGPYCADDLAVTLAITPAAADSGVWSGEVDALGRFVPSNAGADTHEVIYTIAGQCGAADTIDIVVNAVKDATIATADATLCRNDAPIALVTGDLTGTWFINDTTQGQGFELGGTTFDPDTTPGEYNLIYSLVDPCGDLDTVVITVVDTADATILTSDTTVCANEAAFTVAVLNTGGVWSGDVDALGAFNPSNAGAGTYKAFYTFTGLCGAVDSIEIIVNPVKDATIATSDSTICVDDDPVALSTGDLTGTWFVNDTLAGSELGGTSFDPALRGPGNYELIYVLGDPCGDLDTVEITVVQRSDATIVTGDTAVCADEPQFTLAALNGGGNWFKGDTTAGNELVGGVIVPADHSGTFEVYHYISGLCDDIDTIVITINPLQDATINQADTTSFCVLDPNPSFTVATAGGTWDNAAITMSGVTATIDLAALGNVTNQKMIYTLAAPCIAQDSIWITTTSQLDATITQVGPYCDTDEAVTLQVVDGGGIFAGTGITDVNTGVFNPVTAGDGTHTITYTIPGNCGDVQTIDIVVNRTPDATITNTEFAFCEDEGIQALTVAEGGGTWRAINADNGGLNVAGGSFDVTTASAGTYNLEYGFAGACPALDTVVFTVDALPVVSVTPQDTLCENDAAVVIVGSAVPQTSSVWSGVDEVGLFTPMGAVGDNSITYAATNGLCAVDSTITVHVLPNQDATINTVADVCVTDDAFDVTTVNAGGVWSGVGITDAATGTFNPAVAGEGTHTITYAIAGRCGDTKTTQITVVGAPDPTIILPAAVCAGADPFTIQTVTPGGSWSGGGVDASGVFNPTTGGTYLVTYTVTDLCQADSTIEIVVNDIPNTDFDVTPAQGCVPHEATFTDVSDEVPMQTFWNFGNAQSSNDVAGTVVNDYNTTGCFEVTLTNVYANGCSSERTIPDAVCVNANPVANFTFNPSQLDVVNNVAVFEDLSVSGAPIAVWDWDFTEVIQPAQSSPMVTTPEPRVSNAQNPTVQFNSPNGDIMNVKLSITDINGCVSQVEKPLVIIDRFSVFVPNAFTPNDDGINDDFFPAGRNIQFGDNYEFRVYNRWGTLIWMSTTPLEPWDGRVTELAPTSGDIAQVDVYVWRLVVRDPFTGDDVEMVGRVSLVK